MKSKNLLNNFHLNRSIFFLAIVIFAGLGVSSCKKQPSSTVPTAEEQRIEKAKADLRALLNDNDMSIEEMENRLDAIKALNIEDPEVVSLIAQVEAKIARLKAEKLREEEDARRRREEDMRKQRESEPAYKLNSYFNRIAGAGSTDESNFQISQALTMFSSPEAPVLIIIAKDGDIVDYDEPTTINKYLNYLKDQKKKADTIENIVFDDNGKIKELELTKLR
ncbi:hypothetical protein [Chondrinema litorale]|uniref:hypothetical protein n=1 Tax=Chondrinema litorale TaxID=2994555 RepID=UPI002543614E|nr:hypothetical protein [Chondrinema litorale]UZR95676.1 hypothetical protein OQ292_07615 [Chondrinema litorale]